jgi:F-type H+-transporting ATPase subunit b
MDALGIEPTLLIAQIVNFFIIVVVLNVLLYKPILAMLEKRKKDIEAGLLYSEKMKKEDEVAEGKKATLLASARKEGQGIIEEARKTAKIEEKQILEEARKTADEMILKGKATIAQEREVMQKTMRKDSVELAILFAKRLLANSVSEDLQHKILAKSIKEIEKV